MKKYLIPILILCLYSCSNAPKKEVKQEAIQANKTVDPLTETPPAEKEVPSLKFIETKGEAVLIGEKIELLDENLNRIDDISNLSGEIVDIKGISDSLFSPAKDICKAFWYVKIEGKNIKGIVNGRQVFRILAAKKGASFTLKSNSIEFLRTEFLGMGVFYQGDLMDCPVNQPVILKDTAKNYYGLIDLIPNQYSKKAKGGSVYSFFELRNDGGNYDNIDTLITVGTQIKLTIHRGFQEGENHSEVVLTYENNKYIAKYLSFGEIK